MSDFDYSSTRNEIIQDAFEICQVVQTGQVLSGNQLQQGINKLQKIIKHWVTRGIHLWNLNISTFNTTAGNEVYTTAVDQSIIGIDRAFISTGTEDVPLEIILFSKYLDIPNRVGSSGSPTHIAIKRTPGATSNVEIYLYPEPDSVYAIKLLGVYPLQDLDSAANMAGLPVEFQRALTYQLAEDLYDSYPDSISRLEFIQNKAKVAFSEALNFNSSQTETTSEVASLFG